MLADERNFFGYAVKVVTECLIVRGHRKTAQIAGQSSGIAVYRHLVIV